MGVYYVKVATEHKGAATFKVLADSPEDAKSKMTAMTGVDFPVDLVRADEWESLITETVYGEVLGVSEEPFDG